MKWFKHDTNAHTDAKLDKVLMHYGAHGYAVYWYCLELIAGKIEGKNTACALEHDAEQIGARLKIDSSEVNGILTYMTDIGLFEKQIEGAITCLKLLGRLDKSMTNSPQLRKIITDIRQDSSADVSGCHDMSVDVSGRQQTSPQNRIEENRTEESKRKRKTPLPKDFQISDNLRTWAKKNGHGKLNQHLGAFIIKAEKQDYRYVDWDKAFMDAIRNNWARVDA